MNEPRVFRHVAEVVGRLGQSGMLCAVLLMLAGPVQAQQGNLEINTPAVAAVRTSLQARFAQLELLFATGAIGLTQDGNVELRDAGALPLAQRGAASGLIAAENADRSRLYREIAIANGHPEWEADIRSTFAQRWIAKARSGWWVKNAQGAWVRR